MDIKIVQGQRVAECEHCLGSGMCKKCHEEPGKGDYYYFDEAWVCADCGRGELRGQILDLAQKPICSICHGRGFVVLED